MKTNVSAGGGRAETSEHNLICDPSHWMLRRETRDVFYNTLKLHLQSVVWRSNLRIEEIVMSK